MNHSNSKLINYIFIIWFQVKFTSESAAQGNRNYISVNDLYARNFTDANGEFQLELCIGTVRTLFDSEFRIPTSFLGHHIGHRGLHHHGGIATSTLTNIKTPAGTVTKVETSYFSFAGFDWNIALYPHGIKEAHGKETMFFFRFILLNIVPYLKLEVYVV